MIIRQTTTIVFEYPQDYLQEQEWCKTKEDRWVHKSTDTLGAVYENQISYSIGQPNSSEIPNNCEPQTERPRTICGVPSGAEAQTHSDTASVEKERASDDERRSKGVS